MTPVWVSRVVDAPAATAWRLLATPSWWPRWGPSVRSASVDGPLRAGRRGTVTTVAGVTLRFEITAYEEGARWAWKVAGVPATDHTVTPLGPDRCRVAIGVPLLAAPYLAVGAVGLRRLARLAEAEARRDRGG